MRTLQSRRADVARLQTALDCVGPLAGDLKGQTKGSGVTVTLDADGLMAALDAMLTDARQKLAVEELVGSEGAR